MNDISMSNSDLLNYAVENGIIDLSLIQKHIEMQKRKEYLSMHPYKIWEDKNGIWHTYLPDEEVKRVPRKRHSKEEIEDVIVEYWRDKAYNPTVEEVFNEWLDRKLELGKISDSTFDRYTKVFKRHFAKMGKRKIKAIEPIEWEDFLEEQIKEHNLTAKGFANLKTIVKGFLKRAKKRKLIEFSVTETLNEMDTTESNFKTVIKEDRQEVFMEDEMPKIINYLVANPDIWNVGILIMFVTGMRIGEVVALSYDDYCDCPCGFFVRKTETKYMQDNVMQYDVKDSPKTTAGNRLAIIPYKYSWIIDRLRELNPREDGYIFVRNNKRMSTETLRQRFYRVCDKLDIYTKSPHKARKTYATILLDNNVDRNLIIGQMGHTDVETTEHHYHRNRKSLETKASILSQIPEFM